MDQQSTINLRSGHQMPIMGLGTWQLRGEECVRAVGMALELGYRMIDTSSDYGNHAEVGQAINQSRIPRNGIFLVTKVEEDDDAYEAAKEYLGQLGQDYANMMLIHRPPPSGVGEELWRGLMRTRQDGLTKDIGVSNYSIEQLEELIEVSGEVPAVNQIGWSPFGHSQEMLNFCQENGIIIQAYSPLTHQERLDDEVIEDLASKYSKTPAQILIRWNIQLGVVPIVKATSRQHLQENIDVFDFEISSEDMSRLDSLNEQFSALGNSLKYT